MPGTDVATYLRAPGDLADQTTVEAMGSPVGYQADEYEATAWMTLPTGEVAIFDISRTLIPLSDAELELLSCFTDILCSIPIARDEGESARAEFIANGRSFQHLLVTQYLREGPLSGTIGWSPGILINQLQDLVHKQYEGKPATSGFIVVGRPERFLERQVTPSYYVFEPFPERITVEERFFKKPASYRYVDGRAAFYLLDHERQVHGVLRCTDPNRYGRIAEVANEHLVPLLQTRAQEVWAGYIGNNNDINLIITPNKHLRWLESSWHLVDQYHLTQALQQQEFAASEIANCVSVLLTISDLRQGSLILIPDDRSDLPETMGYIDDTRSGRMLYETLVGRSISDLRQHQAALGMLTSDGLTTITKTGTILDCGQIIRIEEMDKPQRRDGGGRTLAALAASQYGLVIKISQDGPISFFKNQQEHIRIVF